MILNRITVRRPSIILVFSASLLLLGSCGNNKKIKGSEFIPEDVFVQIISDMHIMDGVTNDMQYYRKFNPVDSIDIYSTVFKKNNVTRESYEITLNEYSKYPQLLNDVYDQVLMNLNQLLDQVEKEEKEEKLKNRTSAKKIPKD